MQTLYKGRSKNTIVMVTRQATSYARTSFGGDIAFQVKHALGSQKTLPELVIIDPRLLSNSGLQSLLQLKKTNYASN